MEELLLESIIVVICLQYPVWRIYHRAGLKPELSLTLLIPVLGIFISGSILAFSDWKIQPQGDK